MVAMTPQNLVHHELIGLEITVAYSTNSCSVGISGHVIDETRNTLVISQMGSRKIIPKANSRFRFTLPKGVQVDVDGVQIVGGPENRIKKRRRARY
ncbi:ribonuclease P protein component 1 [Candidatus Bathyarchaeota archaeon]|nr:ribonuclease P protein component 1 [Candidatus Bathyarchaeota archaeon]